ncbi:MAG TPA: hypothetical protein VNV82_05815 [Bryobacteraceae bacterium]|nr:hypothetical protein [Bryobacteraceae bacterium]
MARAERTIEDRMREEYSICYRLYDAWHSNWKPKSDTISFAQNIPLEA